MGVVGTYTGHRRPDKLVSGSAFEEVSVCRSEVSAVGREISVLRKGDLLRKGPQLFWTSRSLSGHPTSTPDEPRPRASVGGRVGEIQLDRRRK